VIDYVVTHRTRLERYRAAPPGVVLRLVVLAPGAAVALRRDRERPEKTVAAQWAHLATDIERELGGVGLWVDNGGLSVQETIETILRQRAGTAVR
jgi:hypothetical protein